jgi:hypothetical protein
MKTISSVLALLVVAGCKPDVGNWHTKVTTADGHVYYMTGNDLNVYRGEIIVGGTSGHLIKIPKQKITLEPLD